MNDFFWPGMRRTPPATRALLVVTVTAFALQWVVDRWFGGVFTSLFGLQWSWLRRGAVWQLLTYPFLHGGLWHLVLNSLALFFFAPDVEERIGSRSFLGLYFACGLIGGLGWLPFTIWHAPWAICIGASGAVFGVLGAFAAMFPTRQVTLLVFFVLPVVMTARMLAVLLGLFSLLSAMTDSGSVAHAAHLIGGLAGYLYGRQQTRHDFGSPWISGRWRQPRAPRQRMWVIEPEAPVSLAPDTQEVDRILDKINRSGLRSLTPRERQILESASGRNPGT